MCLRNSRSVLLDWLDVTALVPGAMRRFPGGCDMLGLVDELFCCFLVKVRAIAAIIHGVVPAIL